MRCVCCLVLGSETSISCFGLAAAYCFPGSDTGSLKCQWKDARLGDLKQMGTCFKSSVLENLSVTTASWSTFVSVLRFYLMLFYLYVPNCSLTAANVAGLKQPLGYIQYKYKIQKSQPLLLSSDLNLECLCL